VKVPAAALNNYILWQVASEPCLQPTSDSAHVLDQNFPFTLGERNRFLISSITEMKADRGIGSE
jgi:hypothetical protein